MVSLSPHQLLGYCEEQNICLNPYFYVDLNKFIENKRARTYTIDVIKQYINDSIKVDFFCPIEFQKKEMYTSFGKNNDYTSIYIKTREDYLYLESTKLLNDIIGSIVKINYIFMEKKGFFSNSIQMHLVHPFNLSSTIFYNDDEILQNLRKILSD